MKVPKREFDAIFSKLNATAPDAGYSETEASEVPGKSASQ